MDKVDFIFKKLSNKWQNIFLLNICFIYYLVRGAAKSKKSQKKIINNVLIIQGAKIGDMVCTTPMFVAIKKHYPKCKITVIGNQINEELIDSHPNVDRYVINKNFFETIKIIRLHNIDFGCLTGPDMKSLALLYLSGIKIISAPHVTGVFCPYQTKTYLLLKKLVMSTNHLAGHHVPLQYLNLLQPIGINALETKKSLSFSNIDKQKATLFIKQNNIEQKDCIIGISLSVGHKIRQWPINNFVKLINYIAKKENIKIIIFGNKEDKILAKTLKQSIKISENIIDSSGELDLKTLKAVFSKLDMFISAETGLTFIAEAFDIPLIDIVGPVDDRENSPRGPNFLIVKTQRDKPALHVMNARIFDQHEARRQIEQISPEEVVRAFDKLFLHVIKNKKVKLTKSSINIR